MATPENLFASLLFGAIGLAAFVYGKRLGAIKPVVIGIALMAYPYFVSETWLLYGIGAALTASLFFFRD
jgi:hypothetical protein